MASRQIYEVTIALTNSQFQLLHAMASKRSSPGRQVQVHHLVEQLVDRALLPMSARQYRIAHRDLTITQLHQRGLNDPAIARSVKCNPATVYRTRHRLGLKANDTRGGYHPHHEGA